MRKETLVITSKLAPQNVHRQNFVTTQFQPLLRAALPDDVNNDDHGGESDFRSFLVDGTNTYVLSASHITQSPFTTIYLNTTGGKVWKGCFPTQENLVMGCFYNTSDYAPYRLLHLALTSPVHQNWTVDAHHPNMFMNTVTTSSFDSSNLEDQYSVFRQQLLQKIPGKTSIVYVFVPLRRYIAPVLQARTTTIIIVIIVAIISAVATFFIFRVTGNRLLSLAYRMEDPFEAKLQRKQDRRLRKQNQKSETNNDKNDEVESKEKEEEEEPTTTTTTCFWEDFQPEELVDLENEFAEFRQTILKLRGFLNFDFSRMSSSKKKSHHQQQKEKEKETEEENSNNNVDDNNVGVDDNEMKINVPIFLKSERKQTQNTNLNSRPHLTTLSSATSNDSASNNPTTTSNNNNNNKEEDEDEEMKSQNKKKRKKIKRERVTFSSDVPIPTEDIPGKVIMTKRHKIQELLQERKHNMKIGILPYDKVNLFVAAISCPVFSHAEKFFTFSEKGKQLLLDTTSYIVEKLNSIAVTAGATLIDFWGDHFFFCFQIRKRIVKSKIPTRLSIDLIHFSHNLRKKMNDIVANPNNLDDITSEMTPWNLSSSSSSSNSKSYKSASLSLSQDNSPLTPLSGIAKAFAQQEKVDNNNNNFNLQYQYRNNNNEMKRCINNNDVVTPTKVAAALSRTKIGAKSENCVDAKAISFAMHRMITMYCGFSFGLARLVKPSSFSSFSFSFSHSSDSNIPSPSNDKNDNNNNNNNNVKNPIRLCRSTAFFGSCISEAFSLERTIRNFEGLAHEVKDLHFAIAFTTRCTKLFEVVVARKLQNGEILTDLKEGNEVCRMLGVFHES